MNKDLCPTSCGFYNDELPVKGACDRCINGENVLWEKTAWAILNGVEIVEVEGEGREGYKLVDGGWVQRDAIIFE